MRNWVLNNIALTDKPCGFGTDYIHRVCMLKVLLMVPFFIRNLSILIFFCHMQIIIAFSNSMFKLHNLFILRKNILEAMYTCSYEWMHIFGILFHWPLSVVRGLRSWYLEIGLTAPSSPIPPSDSLHCIHTQNYNPGCYEYKSTCFPVHTLPSSGLESVLPK